MGLAVPVPEAPAEVAPEVASPVSRETASETEPCHYLVLSDGREAYEGTDPGEAIDAWRKEIADGADYVSLEAIRTGRQTETVASTANGLV
jgi:hypothetical protein